MRRSRLVQVSSIHSCEKSGYFHYSAAKVKILADNQQCQKKQNYVNDST